MNDFLCFSQSLRVVSCCTCRSCRVVVSVTCSRRQLLLPPRWRPSSSPLLPSWPASGRFELASRGSLCCSCDLVRRDHQRRVEETAGRLGGSRGAASSSFAGATRSTYRSLGAVRLRSLSTAGTLARSSQEAKKSREKSRDRDVITRFGKLQRGGDSHSMQCSSYY